MKRASKSAVELLEEAVYLLRSAPIAALAAYYLGSVPFVLGFLFFWADMSQSAFGYDHCAPAALGLALLYAWMTYWQSAFVRKLQAELTRDSSAKNERRGGLLQIGLQPTKFLVLPLAALTVLPYASVYAFYQNLMAAPDSGNISEALSAAKKQALVWQSQNWTILAILAMLNFVIFLNAGIAILIVPYLAKLLLGIDNMFTRSGMATFNTTFLAVTASLTYLVAHPLAKAVYVLRYFYSEALETGKDLRIAQTVPGLLLFLLLPAVLPAQPAKPIEPISIDQLNRSIDVVIHRPDFTWRLPRPPRPPEKNPNWFVRMAQSFVDATDRGVSHVEHWINQFVNWLGERLKSMLPGIGGKGASPDSRKLRALVYTLLAAAALVLGWLVWQMLRSQKRARSVSAIPTLAPAVEVNIAEAEAGEQPLDQWLQLARDLMARQELRLALRAFYLAGLSYLAERSLISIQRGKSNQDYARELRRKARTKPELVAMFVENMNVFERAWYGMYPVDGATLGEFEETFVKMRACATEQ